MSALEVVRQILRDHCRLEGPLEENARLIDDLGLDSVGLLTLMTELENHYQKVIQEDFENPPQTVGELAAFVETQVR